MLSQNHHPVFLSIIAGIVMLGGVMAHPQESYAQDASDVTVLTIDGKEFTLNLVGSIINQLPEAARSQPLGNYYDNIIDDMIDTRLTAEAARKSDIINSPQLKEIIERAVDRTLADAWLSDEVRKRITDEMIQKSYNDLVADTESRTEIRARHILLESEDDALAAIARLDNGEDFAELAKELSTGPSAESGGELGYFGRGAMVPSFEAAGFNIAEGSYSKEPTLTQFGWHIIKVEDRRIADPPAFEQVQSQLRSRVSIKIAGNIIAELRNNAVIIRPSFDEVQAAERARQEQAQ